MKAFQYTLSIALYGKTHDDITKYLNHHFFRVDDMTVYGDGAWLTKDTKFGTGIGNRILFFNVVEGMSDAYVTENLHHGNLSNRTLFMITRRHRM
jgi:hypothetical protein